MSQIDPRFEMNVSSSIAGGTTLRIDVASPADWAPYTPPEPTTPTGTLSLAGAGALYLNNLLLVLA
ncbi:hypothetical protein [Piscinibacter gummiphilus]|uniref:Uncharacterized protein n=1 Tax=Piscinibacter gummiphilus TaxID=946333 RepID=A0ABZ0CN98_9BURK|nr:hypothetical protein [Piscinibacter gummiphilus]WOB06466.1 hypothetical protein RXV79_16210 [Piscinibacter gummiphilus]